MIAAAIVMHTLSSVHVALGLRQLLEAFVWNNLIPFEATFYFANQQNQLAIGKLIAYSLSVRKLRAILYFLFLLTMLLSGHSTRPRAHLEAMGCLG